jgi:DnaJ family protein A protein 2
MKNYYDILGISQNASNNEIKKAYKSLAMKHHPDRGGNPENFKQINEAYAVLSDPSKKEKYDRFGSVDTEGINVNDIFQNIFGGAGLHPDLFQNPFFSPFHQQSPFDPVKYGNDRYLDLLISLEEVMNGKTILYKLQRKLFKNSSSCKTCQGKGKIIKQMNLGMGLMTQNIMLCSSCQGKGIFFDESLFEIEEDKIEVVIPPGIPQGTKIVATHKADSYDGFQNGNVVFTIVYEPHKQFRVSENDDHLNLICTIPISLSQFLKGFDVQFTHLNGNVIHLYSTELLAEMISKPLMKRIPSLGLRHNDHTGDLFIEFHIDMSSTPKSLIDLLSKEANEDDNTKSLYYDHEYNIRKLSWL